MLKIKLDVLRSNQIKNRSIAEMFTRLEKFDWFPKEYPEKHDIIKGIFIPKFNIPKCSNIEYILTDRGTPKLLIRYKDIYLQLQTVTSEEFKLEILQHLEYKLSKQKDNIRSMQESLEHKNKALDAMHWVWCNGGCGGGEILSQDSVIKNDTIGRMSPPAIPIKQ
jgi:hypothetical protein